MRSDRGAVISGVWMSCIRPGVNHRSNAAALPGSRSGCRGGAGMRIDCRGRAGRAIALHIPAPGSTLRTAGTGRGADARRVRRRLRGVSRRMTTDRGTATRRRTRRSGGERGESPRRRSGGPTASVADPRQLRRPHRAARSRAGSGGARRGDAGARGGRDRVPERGGARGPEGGGLPDHAGQHQRAHGPGAGDGEGGARTLAVHHHAAQPGARGHHRRTSHGVPQRFEPAELLGPRPRAAGRGPGELPGLPPAHPVLQLHPHGRRLSGGAGRSPPVGAPPRLPLRQAHPDRQGRARLFARHRAGRGRNGDGAHCGRPDARGVRRDAAHVHQHQLLLAAEARLADA